MKEREKKKRKTGMPEAGVFLVILASVGYILLLAGGNPEVFLIDDNRTQWYPIMERAFEDFLTTGRIYCYDFYQMKGMSVAGQGYYGVMNPFMLLAYTVTRLLPGGIDAVTFYIGLMVVLGNFFCFLTCRRLGCGQISAFLLTMAYGTMGCFWAFYVWYYVFNNYFLVPLLIYVFLRCTREGRLMYCACGVVLAMDLWMGNVQYTFYHYILFGILCLTMTILKNGRYLIALCTNAAVGVGLSLPMLLLLLQASDGFQKHVDFMKAPLLYFSLLIHSVIPQGILRRHGSGISFLDSYVMGRDDNLVCYMGGIGMLLFAMLVRLGVNLVKRAGEWERRQASAKERQAGTAASLRRVLEELRAGYGRAVVWSHEKKTVAGCIAALFFFLSLMSGGVAARFLRVMPVVNNFRYLFKAIFSAVPLAVLILAYLVGVSERERGQRSCEDHASDGEWDTISGKKRAGWRSRVGAAALTVIFLCVGVVNACDTVALVRHMFDMRIEGSFAKEKEIARTAVEAAGVDGKNYRMAAFLQFPGANDESFNLSGNLTRNFSTAVGTFSLAGYEMATEQSRMEMFDAVFTKENGYAVFVNADTLERFCQNLQEQPETVLRQLMENSVRYLLLDKTTLADNRLARETDGFFFQNDHREDTVAALRTLPDIRVERVCPFNDRYDLVELAGVNSLCIDGTGQMVPLKDENMQTLSFDAQAKQDYILSFAWDSRLKAFVTGADGAVRPLPVNKTKNGNVQISVDDQAGGRVTLTWHDPLCTAGFIWEGVTTFAFFGVFTALAFIEKKCYSDSYMTD